MDIHNWVLDDHDSIMTIHGMVVIRNYGYLKFNDNHA